ncbi:protein O-linked-mannose beta-1,2-N-acetylglucosaminyltransferase 1-like [Saccostrea echinata]|uniref:protein O-linked-mannose beta-1,2-N-acetylglucosaminyltransferase 1-like n=1 Tax=Saccostrea echinata TaxID=191078 RepID=UPI002A83C4C0|nr:protein O-linked-mannose beta-1,2-N-acetylglucosaminyltransferase 1-like [Saccostrea echinata]
MLLRKKWVTRILQGGLLLILVVTAIVNISFIKQTHQRNLDQAEKRSKKRETPAVSEKKDEENPPTEISLGVTSSKSLVLVTINGNTVYQDDDFDVHRGIHLLVLNQATGHVMAKQVFDTYSAGEDQAMLDFIDRISKNRILVFTIKDEGSFQLKPEARAVLGKMGSVTVEKLTFRDMWIFICFKGGKVISERHNKAASMGSWGDRITVTEVVKLVPVQDSNCPWTKTEPKRQAFCEKMEGYGKVCDCQNPDPITFHPSKLDKDNLENVAITVIASNRPQYMYRMLIRLLSTAGVKPEMITVFIDGFFEEPLEVTRLLGLRGIQHTPLGKKNARVSQHYKASLTSTFDLHPSALYTIVIEEDLDVSPDFFNYFSQTIHLMEKDDTLYCISAWNDQGYSHSCKEPSLLYRVETMPGLGWLLKKKLFKTELEKQWPSPDKQWDWDMWMRLPTMRKGRECIIPDISRTYHFGSKGLNMNPYFQEVYFKKHSILNESNVILKDLDRMTSEKYEELINEILKTAKVVDHTKDPCDSSLIPKNQDTVHVLYIQMQHPTDFTTWKQLAKCYHLWDLDVRGLHKSMWRLYLNGTPVMLVGVPHSPYHTHKPSNVTPFVLQEPSKKP